MTTRLAAIAALILVFGACNNADTNSPDTAQQSTAAPAGPIAKSDVPKALASITAEKILEGTKILSADDMEGRGTGTAGEKKAAEWIAGQYKAAGLKAFNGDFFQKVDLVGFKKDASASSLTLAGPDGSFAFEEGENFTFWSSSQKEQVSLKDVPVVFVGYGVEAPEYNWNDYKDVDVKGKVLLFLNSDPPVTEDGQELFGGEARTYYGRWTYKFEQAMQRGAAGAIMIHTDASAGYGWPVIHRAGLHEGFALDLPNTGYQVDLLAWMHQDLAGALAATVDKTLDDFFAMAKTRDFVPVTLPVKVSADLKVDIRKTSSQNVVGYLEGSDPKMKDQYLVYSAHYDHLGMKDEGEDRIYNGAWDNALGTVCISELAKAYAISEVKPKRSIIFLACAAEEKGILGSLWFNAKPPVPTKQLIANINIDMPQIFGFSRDIVAIGKSTNQLGDWLTQIAADFGYEENGATQPIAIKDDDDPNAGSFYRSDQLPFVKAGIPALFINPGTDFVTPPKVDDIKAYAKGHYHQLEDEVNDSWDLTGCARDMRVVFLLGLKVANHEDIPRWAPGNEFESAWLKNHGEN